MKWLYRLEHKYGKYYLRGLMTIIVIGMAAVYVLDMAAVGAGFNMTSLLSLNRSAILRGEVWRLITFIFVPSSTSPLWLLISLYFYYMMGRNLEYLWGGFRLNLYYLVGVIGAIISCFITGFGTNVYLNLSLFLAFATIAPDTGFMLFFVLQIKAKWLALGYAAFLAVQLVFQFFASPIFGALMLVSLLFSLINYALFFGNTLIRNTREQIRISRNRRNWRGR